MNYKEYRQCQMVARVYNSKVDECEKLKRRNAVLERENKLLKERLGYRKIADTTYAAADDDCIVMVNAHRASMSA